MGSTQKIFRKRINKRLKVALVALSPLLVMGVSSILFQFFQMSKVNDFTIKDVDVTNLWPYSGIDKKDQIANAMIEEPVITLKREPSAFMRKIKMSELPVQKITRPAFTRKVKTVSKKNIEKLIPNTQQIVGNEVEIIELEPQDIAYLPKIEVLDLLPSGRLVNLNQKEFLLSKNIQVKKGKWSIGASFSPNLVYRTFGYYDVEKVASRIDDGVAYIDGQSKGYRNEQDGALLHFSSGIDLYYNSQNKWSIQTGIYYTSLGEQIQVVKNSTNLITGRGTAEPDLIYYSPENTAFNDEELLPFNNYYGLIEVPMNIRYQIWQKNTMQLDVTAGFTFSKLDHVDALVYNYENKKYEWQASSNSELFNSMLFSSQVGIQWSQFISEEVKIFANPRFRYYGTPTFSSQYEIKQNQWIVGVRLGLQYQL